MTTDDQTPLPDKLRTLDIKRIWAAGLTLEYCIYHSALSAHALSLEFNVILPGCRAISEESAQKALAHMKKMGIFFDI